MVIEKRKTREGFAYPLKSSVLEKTLTDAGIITNVHLIIGGSNLLFEAFYWLPNNNIPYARFYLRTGAFEASEVKALRAKLESAIIPEFILWAKDLLALPKDSSKLQQEQHIYW